MSLIPGVTARLSRKHPRGRSRGTVVVLAQGSVCTLALSESEKLNYHCPHRARENYCSFCCKSCEIRSLKRVIPDLWDVTAAAPVTCRHPGPDCCAMVRAGGLSGRCRSLSFTGGPPIYFMPFISLTSLALAWGTHTKHRMGRSGDRLPAAWGWVPHGTWGKNTVPALLGGQLPLPVFNAGAGGIIH